MGTSNSKSKLTTLGWIGLAIVVAPAGALAGLTAQGLTAQGLTAQGLTAQGLTAQGLTAQGLTAQGLTAQGLTAQGLTAQGLTAQGLTAQGLTAQGLTAQGLTAQGADLMSADLKGVAISSVDIRGKTATSDVVTYELTSIPGVSTGTGNYITVDGLSVVGRYAVAHLVDGAGLPAEDLDLYIAGEQVDPIPNLFHRADEQDNQDELYVVYSFNKFTGQWVSLCPYNPLTESASAMAIPEDPTQPNRFIFACTATGVASKCARNWGYRPWASTTAYVFDDGLGDWVEKTFALKDYYDACTVAARAGYCQDGKSYTKAGTLVDLFDTRQIIWPNAVENPFNAANPDSQWMMAQEYFISFAKAPTAPASSTLRDSALQRTRYHELSPIGECDDLAYVDRLEHDHFEDGRWANPLTNVERIEVFSPTYCTHNEYESGAGLPWDCSPCTTQVCKTNPSCCTSGPANWDATCAAVAGAACKDGNGTQLPKGRVWPRDIDTSGPVILPKFLLGPTGAVERVDGVSTSTTAATVSGWACDPEWPGSSISVRIYGGAPRDLPGSVLLGEVRAGDAVASPLANEVSALCDGPNRDHARHGFSFALPSGTTGNVFVYAVDQETADGPAAPPTLLRNGIAHVPTCAHSEHVAGPALDAACSACAGSVCGAHADCCSTAWTDECAAAADDCAPATSSAAANSRVLAVVTTGWIEAPATGTFVFDASLQPSRLVVNGSTLLDWFNGAGTTQGSIDLVAGVKYPFRWDRFQAEPPANDAGPAVTWQLPGASSQTAIPSGLLYRLAPGSGTGLAATYYAGVNFTGATKTQTDAFVDINDAIAPPSTPTIVLPVAPPYSAKWAGELVPAFSEDYTFYLVGTGSASLKLNGAPVVMPAPTVSVVGAGCPHDLCTLGDKLAASAPGTPACDPCVDAICTKDPYCCDGGYLSYYSTEPVWDARCIAEVKAFCPGFACTGPIPGPGAPQQKSVTIPLLAGVRYNIEVDYDNAAASLDKTIRLMWASARTPKQVIPQSALFPAGAAVASAGAGLNVTMFGTTAQNGTRTPNLTTALAGGATPDLAITGDVDGDGTPLVEVTSSTAVATPPPPAVARPRYDDKILGETPAIALHGIGGLVGGSVRVTVDEDATLEAIATVAADGSFDATITPAGFGKWTLRLVQRTTTGATCVAPACLESYAITWPVTVSLTPPSGPAPVITAPRDPTHSPNPAANVFSVVGQATPNTAVSIQELGGSGASVSPATLVPDVKGLLAGKLTLSAGDDTDPNKGWHKLVFQQGGADSKPVFVSVGIRPPTVVFPRSGAEIDCSDGAPSGRTPQLAALLPYTVAQFGQPRVYEETGAAGLRAVPNEGRVFTQQVNGQLQTGLITTLFLDYGKHLVYVFQAPDPPATATQAEIDAHFRAYASLANTPQSRIQIDVPPPRFQTVAGGSLLVRGTKAGSTLPFNVGDCVPGQSAPDSGCALPLADVNVYVGPRLFTTRADANGSWSLTVPLNQGWNDVKLTQVIDSDAGGGWRESCPSNTIEVGVETDGTISFNTPGALTAVATSPAGAKVEYVVTAQSSLGHEVQLDCLPASGATFPIGTTLVHCTGVDKSTGGISLGGFQVTVIDGPPVINYPAGGLTVEATGPLGALVSYDVTATDAVSGKLPVDCAPASPVQVMVDGDIPVTCEATDGKNPAVDVTFPIRVVDTTPPVLCPLPDVVAGTNSGAGAIVNFATCANDLVDGGVAVICDHPSGSTFAVGKTAVTCTAVDKHGNAASATFTVSVGDATPPVLKLPGTITAYATSRKGAKVSYTVTATDNVDKNPSVSCAPASGSTFPLGRTTVSCKAKDAAGNVATGSFLVKVVVSFGGFTSPANNSKWRLKSSILVRFKLNGVSAQICDLPARLFVAPIDATGNVGTEKPAPGVPPCNGNLFDFDDGQYELTLDARQLAIGTWQLRADLGDGESHAVTVSLTK
jgi:hypothetical protein